MSALDKTNQLPPFGRERRLAAVAVLDIVGYSTLMEADEAGTHGRWTDMCGTLIVPMVHSHHGRIVKSTGDGFLIEFRAATDAMKWALGLRAALASSGEEKMLPLRTAVHIGQIIPEQNDDFSDIFGDDVNIVSRLHEYAEPNSIIISAALHEQVKNVIGYNAEDLGPLALKNIRRPIQAFNVCDINETPRKGRIVRAQTKQPSIAVIPPRVLAEDNVAPYVAEGIVHNIVASLAGLKELFVISSSSTIGLAGTTDKEGVGRRLGVHYLVSGAISRSRDKIRLYSELSEVLTSEVLWSDRYEIPESELFSTQDEIASKIAYSLIPHLRHSELQRALRKPPENVGAHDLVLQALYRLHRFGEGDFEKAHELLNQAITRDPEYSNAYAILARWHIMRIGQGYSTNVENDSAEAHRLAQMALERQSSNPIALAIYGHILSFLFRRYDEALEAFEGAIASSPSSAFAWSFSSPTFSYIGDGASAVQRAERGLLLSPLDPQIYWTQSALTLAHYVHGTFEESVRWGRQAVAMNSRYSTVYRPLIASLVATNLHEQAKELASFLLRLEPNFRIDLFIERHSFRNEKARALYGERLASSGLPR